MEQGTFPQHHQQGMAPWYPGPPPPPYQQQVAAHQQQQPHHHHHHPLQWSSVPPPSMPPSSDQSFSYPAYHHPPQGDYYSQQQVHHQYPPPVQPQFSYMYNQQDQMWQGNNNWNYQQWSYSAQSGDLSKEEVWAAKARAWAASKAVQDESRTIQQGPTATTPQAYQEYGHQQRDTHLLESQTPMQPPTQDGSCLSYYQSAAGQVQSVSSRPISEAPMQKPSFEKPVQDTPPLVISEPNFDNDQKAVVGGDTPQSNDIQSVFNSSNMHDASECYRIDNGMSGPGGERHDSVSQVPHQHPAAPLYNQPTTHLLPQSQASPLISQPRFNFNEKPIHSFYEQHPQQLSSNYHQPPIPQQSQLQPQYQPSVVNEVREGDFGLSPASMQNWPPVGGPGMPFPPAGAPQFDHLHPPHHMSVPMYGRPDAPQGLGFPNSGPFVAGLNPALAPPGPGAPVRPFAPENFVEKPKKAAVPSWLREELIKKKAAALAGNNTGTQLSDETSRVNGEESINPLSQRLGLSNKLASSSPGLSDDEEEDQEEEIEAARNAAINQEIKRLLTEVLLKVTGDLFEEIAQEVLDEEDEDEPKARTVQSKSSGQTSVSSVAITPASSGRVLVSSVKVHATDDSDDDNESSSSDVPAADVLGLGSYASDDETPDSNDNQENGEKVSTEQNLSNVETEEQKTRNEVISVNSKSEDVDNAEQEKIVDDVRNEQLNRQSDAVNEASRKRGREHDRVKSENGEPHGTARSEIKESRSKSSLRPEREICNAKDEKEDRIRDSSAKEKEANTKEKNGKLWKSLDSKGREHSSRDDKKDKVKEKAKPREKDNERDRRKHDKKEKESRSKRTDSVERRHRRHSPSSSCGGSEGSTSSSSDNSRGRSHARRSSKHQTQLSSPGRSRKSSRRLSRSHSRSPSPHAKHSHRSRSRSRSPHGKHSHRKNASSPSREKSRRNVSTSPVLKRRRS